MAPQPVGFGGAILDSRGVDADDLAPRAYDFGEPAGEVPGAALDVEHPVPRRGAAG
ncbi:hypothetical protein ACWD4J_34985 [Streptomyces sp. NPDC002577]